MLSQPNPYDKVDTANLFTVKFSNLFDRDSEELDTLLQACERDGFFYLDLQDSCSAKLWRDLDRVSEIAKRWFSQPVEDKLKTPTVSLAHGFVDPNWIVLHYVN
ncbi:2og-fe oxygenase family [Fusarium mexicanum]|uniref:2og-fe oxygenase family n=1 Tax=Fusarium mexicanum TaxID=751941 RepID=A0A8H5MRH7_9HYPO|nr:2og-fe oxygenase family [Fusarium mexicanum]